MDHHMVVAGAFFNFSGERHRECALTGGPVVVI